MTLEPGYSTQERIISFYRNKLGSVHHIYMVVRGSLQVMNSADKHCKSLDPDQVGQNVWPDLDPNCLALMTFLKDLICLKR